MITRRDTRFYPTNQQEGAVWTGAASAVPMVCTRLSDLSAVSRSCASFRSLLLTTNLQQRAKVSLSPLVSPSCAFC